MRYIQPIAFLAVTMLGGVTTAVTGVNDAWSADGAPFEAPLAGECDGCDPPCPCGDPCGCDPPCPCDDPCGCDPPCPCDDPCGCDPPCPCDDPCGCDPPCPCDDPCTCDKTPPTVTVKPPLEMWPPNHKYHSFDLSDCVEEVKDNCDAGINVNEAGKILSIYSDEPENAQGDGNTVKDIVITSDSSFNLRSERQGGSNGRVYGIKFTVTDNGGNATTATCYVTVPHDQSGNPAVNDGPGAGYTVYN